MTKNLDLPQALDKIDLCDETEKMAVLFDDGDFAGVENGGELIESRVKRKRMEIRFHHDRNRIARFDFFFGKRGQQISFGYNADNVIAVHDWELRNIVFQKKRNRLLHRSFQAERDTFDQTVSE